jgi:hypothetical protein
LAVAVLGLLAAPALAVEGQKGEFSWSWDNTISYGAMWRVGERDPSIIGLASGGTAFSVNGDDGNLNYDKGIVSNAVKWTSEFEFSYKNFGGFLRGFAFYDYENERKDRARTELSDEAKDRVGSRAEIRDAFLWLRFGSGVGQGEIRAGKQVINWGESTFIQGGINAINPFDVSVLRVPGAELRDALLPVGAVLVSFKPSRNTSVEAFYQYDWEEVKIDPVGSYFSTTDLAGAGATKVLLGFGAAPDFLPVGAPVNVPVGVVVPRGADRKADDSGQYGVAVRWFVPAMGGTEFGLYHLNYHSRLPVIMAHTGTLGALLAGNYAASAEYFLAYPEDIKLYGASFNAQLGRTGIALQGEVSHRKDLPLQMDDVELLFAALTPLRLVPELPGDPLAPLRNLGNLLAAFNQVGAFGFDEEIDGSVRLDTTNVQMTGTKIFGRFLGADQFVFVTEVGWGKVHDMPDRSVLRLEAPGTYTSANPIFTTFGVQPATESDSAFPTTSAWGYVVAGRWDYNNAFGAVNLSPRFSFAHDVSGVSPGPGGNFIEGRKALTVGFGFQYRINWEWDVSYTRYFGAGRYNLLNDRDFVAANIKYSF